MAGFSPDNAFDILFSFDTTGSMSRAIEEVKGRVGDMISRLKSDIPFIRIGVIAHGDYCDKDVFYLEQHLDFSSDIVQLQNFVNGIEGTGGGDPEECYEYVLRMARGLSWAPGSQRALVVIGDSVPHEPDYELNTDNLDWRVEAAALMEMGVKIYGVQAFEEEVSTKFFEELVTITHGQHIKLSEFSNICDMILAICYREKGAEYLEGYEAEVRAREAMGLHKDLEGMFGTLRRGDSNSSNPGPPRKALSAGGSVSPMPLVSEVSLISPLASPSTSGFAPVVAPIATAPIPGASTPPSPSPSVSDVSSLVSFKPLVGKPRAKTVKVTKPPTAKLAVAKAGGTKIAKPKPNYRHLVSNSNFVLSHRSVASRWTGWKLVMFHSINNLESSFIPRKQTRYSSKPGYKRQKLFPGDRPGHKALYEIAVQKERRLKRNVVYSKVCTVTDCCDWERKLLNSPFLRRQVNHVIENKGFIWVRRFMLKGMGKRQREIVHKYLDGGLYNYIWNPKTKPDNPGKLSWAMETD